MERTGRRDRGFPWRVAATAAAATLPLFFLCLNWVLEPHLTPDADLCIGQDIPMCGVGEAMAAIAFSYVVTLAAWATTGILIARFALDRRAHRFVVAFFLHPFCAVAAGISSQYVPAVGDTVAAGIAGVGAATALLTWWSMSAQKRDHSPVWDSTSPDLWANPTHSRLR